MTALPRVVVLWSVILSVPAAAVAHQRICLPPVFEGGQRLHPLPAPRVFWLELLLRQHELCWRRSPEEVRVALVGNSGIYGYPLSVDKTFGAVLNARFAAQQRRAHVFNLALVNSYQLRDAVVIHEALRYEPDVLLYPITLAEFIHIAPVVHPPQLVQFFSSNKRSLYELASKPPAGLTEVLAVYRAMLEETGTTNSVYSRLREFGAFARVAAQQYAHVVRQRLTGIPPTPVKHFKGRQTAYDCQKMLADTGWQYDHWRDWSVLGYAAELQRRSSLQVVIVNWPVAHEPVGDCYNVRWAAATLAEYNDWLAAETAALGLRYVDLHDFLAPEHFLDSLHVSAEGHQRIADRLVAELDPVVQAIAARKTQAAR